MARRNSCEGAGVSILNACVVKAHETQGSCLDAALVNAYLQAEYWVQDGTPFCLKIGVQSLGLWQRYQRFSVDCGAVLTAFNPLGQKSTRSSNIAKQAL